MRARARARARARMRVRVNPNPGGGYYRGSVRSQWTNDALVGTRRCCRHLQQKRAAIERLPVTMGYRECVSAGRRAPVGAGVAAIPVIYEGAFDRRRCRIIHRQQRD